MLINEKFLELPDFQKFCTDYCFQIFKLDKFKFLD